MADTVIHFNQVSWLCSSNWRLHGLHGTFAEEQSYLQTDGYGDVTRIAAGWPHQK